MLYDRYRRTKRIERIDAKNSQNIKLVRLGIPKRREDLRGKQQNIFNFDLFSYIYEYLFWSTNHNTAHSILQNTYILHLIRIIIQLIHIKHTILE